jgi:hypothetical protein
MSQRRERHAGKQNLRDEERAGTELAQEERRIAHVDEPGLHPALELVSAAVCRCPEPLKFRNDHSNLRPRLSSGAR